MSPFELRFGRKPAFALAYGEGGGVGDPLVPIFGATSGYYEISLSTCFKDTAGTDPCAVDGDLIKCMRGSYGGLPDLVQATDALCPVFKDDGSGRWRADMSTTAVIASAATLTVDRQHLIAFARELSAGGTAGLFSVLLDATNYHRIQNVSSSDRNAGAVRTTASGLVAANSPASQFPLNTPLVTSSRVTDTGVDVQRDNNAITEAATTMALGIASTAIQIGPFGVTGKVWGAAVHRAAAISAADRTAIVTALAALQGRSI